MVHSAELVIEEGEREPVYEEIGFVAVSSATLCVRLSPVARQQGGVAAVQLNHFCYAKIDANTLGRVITQRAT